MSAMRMLVGWILVGLGALLCRAYALPEPGQFIVWLGATAGVLLFLGELDG